ncbi:leucine-rich repeat and guanylate kinase domain-containing protein-like [Homalodisca vitripennis]|uniref:leucine-rich repeat and guanylate kinase domain-containing protein-like n=1 Tax=Homalodisca vitripennis TaxID=197043 RepID=UPI001EEA1C5C|nr:leucine-rich repeat and guanylate kinase domain-containing protein-like [Homalodisca vitripennis]
MGGPALMTKAVIMTVLWPWIGHLIVLLRLVVRLLRMHYPSHIIHRVWVDQAFDDQGCDHDGFVALGRPPDCTSQTRSALLQMHCPRPIATSSMGGPSIDDQGCDHDITVTLGRPPDCTYRSELHYYPSHIIHRVWVDQALMTKAVIMTVLWPWDLFTLKKLNISCNCVTELYEINNLKGDTKCYELNITNNPVCSNIGYREFVIYLLPNLRILDTVPIKCSERVAAKMLLEPDIFTSAQHLRTKLELWNQLALREINTETIPSDEPPVPLLVLVGTFMNGREEIAKALILKFPNQVYRCKKYTTLPLEKNRNTDHLKSVPIDEFNNMIKTGKLIFYYKEIGFFFGMCQDEISTCIVEGKIGLVDTTLEAALVMKYSQLRPFLVLSVTEDVESYSEKLKNCFMDLDLWTKYNPAVSKNLNSGQKPKRWSESKPDNLKAKSSHESIIKTPSFTTSDADIMQNKGMYNKR